MKKKFSKKWKSSIRPGKQRKYRINAPMHIRKKMIQANLNKELRKKYSRRNIALVKGDEVKIMVGEFKNKTGKINLIDLKKLRVGVDGIYKNKKDGTKISIYFNPSNLQIKELNLENKTRVSSLERKSKKHNKNKTGEKNAPKEK